MRSKQTILLATTVSLGLSACTTSLETRLDAIKPTETLAEARKGVSYSLPMRRYDIAVTRRLLRCNTSFDTIKLADATHKLKQPYVMPTLAFATTATATGKLISGERYLIDYEALSSSSKVTDFKIEYHPGSDLLKSVNASADDQTGDIIGKTLAAAGTIAITAFSPATGAALGAALVGNLTNGQTAALVTPTKLPPQPRSVVLLDELLDSSSTFETATQCADKVVVMVEDRNKRSAELERLDGGKIDTEWTEAQIDPATGVKRPRPLPAGATLEVLNNRMTAMLPYLGVKPFPPAVEVEVNSLRRWQAAVVIKAKSITNERDDFDKKLSSITKVEWPLKFDEQFTNGKEDLAKISDADNARMVGLFVNLPMRIIEPDKVKKILIVWSTQRKDDLVTLMREFPDFMEQFVEPSGSVKEQKALPTSCFGPTAKVEVCLNNRFTVQAQLEKAPETMVLSDPPQRIEVYEPGVPVADRRKNSLNNKLFEKNTASTNSSSGGLFIRPPVMATLKICPSDKFDGTKNEKGHVIKNGACATNIIDKPELALVPQLGQLRLLPLKNGTFANNGISVSLAEDGRLISFGYMNKRAVGAAIAATLSDAATQYQAYEKAKQDKTDAALKRVREATTNKIADLQNQIDEKEKQQKLDDLNAPKTPATDIEKQLKSEGQQTSILKSQLLLLVTEQCLAQAKANPTSPTTCPVE